MVWGSGRKPGTSFPKVPQKASRRLLFMDFSKKTLNIKPYQTQRKRSQRCPGKKSKNKTPKKSNKKNKKNQKKQNRQDFPIDGLSKEAHHEAVVRVALEIALEPEAGREVFRWGVAVSVFFFKGFGVFFWEGLFFFFFFGGYIVLMCFLFGGIVFFFCVLFWRYCFFFWGGKSSRKDKKWTYYIASVVI